jgi:hypothetical protein
VTNIQFEIIIFDAELQDQVPVEKFLVFTAEGFDFD